MNILISTSKSFSVLNIETEEIKDIHQNDGAYWGIAFSEKEIFVATHKCYDTKKSSFGEIFIFDYSLNFKRALKYPMLKDIHQIAYDDERALLFVVCTGHNIVMIYNTETKSWHRWQPFDKAGFDYNHINSVYIDKKFNYLCRMRKSLFENKSEIWKFTKEGDIVSQLNIAGEGLHNILKEGEDFYSLESYTGYLVGTNGTKRFIDDLWLRGYIYVPGEYRIIGGSLRDSERSLRQFSDGALVVFDDDWNFIKKIELSKRGNIHDIAVPDRHDLGKPQKGNIVKW